MTEPSTSSITRQRPAVFTADGMVTTRWSSLIAGVVVFFLAGVAWWQIKSDTAQALAEVKATREETKAMREEAKPYQGKVDRLWLLYELAQGKSPATPPGP